MSIDGGDSSSGSSDIGGDIGSGSSDIGGDIGSSSSDIGGDIGSGSSDIGGDVGSGSSDIGGDIGSGSNDIGGDEIGYDNNDINNIGNVADTEIGSITFRNDVDAHSQESIGDDSTQESVKTPEQVNLEKQSIAVKQVDVGDVTTLSNKEKGNYGEMKTDLAMADLGYERISEDTVTSIDEKIHKGIDGVYEKSIEDDTKSYCIVESKYGTSELGELKDGTPQMSKEWIDDRLVDAVGEEKFDEINLARLSNPDCVETKLARINSDGEVTFFDLDNKGNIIRD